MIDYLLCAPDEPTARADATLAAFYLAASWMSPGGWDGSCVIPSVQVWLDSGDVTTGTDPITGQPIVTHSPLPGFWLVVSQVQRNAALEASPYLMLGADRDAASPTNTGIFVFGPGQSAARFVGAHVSPTFAGSAYPFGASA